MKSASRCREARRRRRTVIVCLLSDGMHLDGFILRAGHGLEVIYWIIPRLPHLDSD